MAPEVRPLGWWVLSGASLTEALRRAHEGEEPMLIMAELYANSETESLEPDEGDGTDEADVSVQDFLDDDWRRH